jgi:1-acyl-sn-glycerol-3-phosphate acyltransferase
MKPLYWIVRNTCWLLFKGLYRHRTYGKKHIRVAGGGIIAPNHISYYDPPVIALACPTEVHFLARKTLFELQLLKHLIPRLNSHPTTRGGADLETIRMICQLIQKGAKVVIFPEGTRSPNGKLHAARPGVGMIGLRTQCKIFPVYIHGTYEIFSRRRSFPKLWGKTACVFGSPFSTKDYAHLEKKKAQQEISSEVMRRIAELKEWYEKGAKGSPP